MISARRRASALGALLVATAWVSVPVFADSTPVKIPDLSGKALTVTGPVDPETLGPTLMHEHLFIDFQPTRTRPAPQRTPAQAAAYNQPLSLKTIAQARYGMGVAGGGTIGDFDLVYKEAMEFKKWGGRTIVDVSSHGLGRAPHSLHALSEALGMNIVMGSGWYQKAFFPVDMDSRTVEDLTDDIVHDIVVGADDTKIRSGIIGEVGVTGAPLVPNEMKSVRASARASRLTGAPMTFHLGGRGAEKLVVLDAVAAEGVDMSHVVMSHMNSIATELPLLKAILARGVFVEFDYLGVIGGPRGVIRPYTDRTLANTVVKLVKEGYVRQILLSHDICTKIQLKSFGGNGYSYISEYFLPELRRMGVSEADIHTIMVDNPRRALTFTKPRELVSVNPAKLDFPRKTKGDAASPVGPWLGTWERAGSTGGSRWLLQMSQVGDGFRVLIYATSPGGRPVTVMDAYARFDSQPYPEIGNASADFDIFSRVDDRTYALRDIKDGKETVRFEATISDDGQTRTSVATRTNRQGQVVHSTGVWTRVE